MTNEFRFLVKVLGIPRVALYMFRSEVVEEFVCKMNRLKRFDYRKCHVRGIRYSFESLHLKASVRVTRLLFWSPCVGIARAVYRVFVRQECTIARGGSQTRKEICKNIYRSGRFPQQKGISDATRVEAQSYRAVFGKIHTKRTLIKHTKSLSRSLSLLPRTVQRAHQQSFRRS